MPFLPFEGAFPPRVSTAAGVSTVGAAPVQLQAEESAPDANVTLSSEQWFAVVASYSTNGVGRNRALAMARAVGPSLGCAEIWRTKISRNYAVVLGGRTGRAAALANAQRARSTGVAPDAFTQADREWTQETRCP